MSIVAIIPARGGSKGIPGKNKNLFAGIPLIGHTIRAAKRSKLIDKVYVSSDDPEILNIANDFGAESILRPAELSSDAASSESALLHGLGEMATGGLTPDYVVFLQCTSPFTTADEMDKVISACQGNDIQSAFSAVEDHGFLWSRNEEGLASGINHNSSLPRARRQDLEPQYRENGAIYVMAADQFQQDKHRFCGNTAVVPIDGHAIEIDTPQDWDVAEKMFRSITPPQYAEGFSKIKAVIMDFDGVHTDNRVIVDENGFESVICDRGDGFGLEMLRKSDISLLILSKEKNIVVAKRAEKLKLDVIHGVDDKVSILEVWLAENNLSWPDIAYIGNDLNDKDCIQKAGIGFCPADSHSTVIEVADIVLSRAGGKGAIREMSDLLLRHSKQESNPDLAV